MKNPLKFWKWFTILALTIAFITLAGCSSSSTPTPTTSSTPTATTSTTPTMTMPPTTSTAPATTTTAPTTSGPAVNVALTAKNIAFDKSTITVTAGSQVTVNFNNMDSGIPHNFAVYTDSGAGTSIFVGPTITGPNITTYQFTAPAKAGTYFFRCDIHPTIMTGQFIVQ